MIMIRNGWVLKMTKNLGSCRPYREGQTGGRMYIVCALCSTVKGGELESGTPTPLMPSIV